MPRVNPFAMLVVSFSSFSRVLELPCHTHLIHVSDVLAARQATLVSHGRSLVAQTLGPLFSYLIVSAMLTCLRRHSPLPHVLNHQSHTFPYTRMLNMILYRPLLQIKRQQSPPGSWSVRFNSRFFNLRHSSCSHRRRNSSAAQPAHDPYPTVITHTCGIASP